jgi:hypothetical protein
MILKEIIDIQGIFSQIFNFYEYAKAELPELDEKYGDEFTLLSLNEMQEWKVSKKVLCYSFFRIFEHTFHQGKYVNICSTAKVNDRGKQYYLSLQQEIDGNFEKYCRQLNTYQLKTFSLLKLENEYVSSLAFFEHYYSLLPEFKLAKYSYITDGNKELIFRNRSKNNFRGMFIQLYKLFPKETEIFENIFDNRISDYLVSKYLENELVEDISTFDNSLLTYESEPVFSVFFASKASFIIFKNAILPEKGDQISRVELWLIFDFFRQNKLKFQIRGKSSETRMGRTKEQKKFIKAINPFFKKKYIGINRIDNYTPAANKEYPIMDRLDDEYKKMKEKVKEINNY